MSDLAWRLILVASALGLAVLAAGLAHLRRRMAAARVERSPLDLSDLDGRVLFFSAADCPSCDSARSALEALGAEPSEIPYGERPEAHHRAGVTGVPLIVVRDRDGGEIGRIAGKPPRKRLRRLLQDAAGK